jgi:hypothetical protein
MAAWAMQIVAMISLCGAPCWARGLQEAPPRLGLELNRIRSSHGGIDARVRDGYRRSPTFKMLVDTLERSAVFVYITPGRCRPMDAQRLTACLITFGVDRGVHQLRIIVDIGLATDHLIATLGHELQHAIETSQPEMRRSRSQRERRVRFKVNETDAAERVGRAIRGELR